MAGSGRNGESSKTPFLPLLFAFLDVAATVTKFIVANAVILKEGKNIADRCFGDVVERFFGQEGLVGCHDDIRHGDQQ